MAQKIDRKPRRRTFYPWHEWLDGATYRAVEGIDFTCSPNNFQTALHTKGRNLNRKVVTTNPEKGIIEFQFTDEPNPARANAIARQTSQV